MWGNPTRERERSYLLLQEKTLQQHTHNFQPRRNTSQQQICPRIFCLEKRAQIRTAVRPPQILCLEKRAQLCAVRPAQYGPAAARNLQKNLPRFLCQRTALKIMPSSCCTDSYSTAKQQKIRTALTQKNSLAICALLFLGNVPTKLLTFLSQALSKNLSQSPSFVVSCTLPNAFFYKSENDIFPPKCLFTFPNPKSKGQDLILHFSRSRVMIHSLQNESLKILK
jgi:hypothetical protein